MAALTMQQQNYSEMGASEGSGPVGANDGSKMVDDSLTSLNWLHNLNIMGELHTSTPPTPPASPGPLNGGASDTYGGHSGGDLSRFCGVNGVTEHRNLSSAGLMGPPTSSGPSLNSFTSSVSNSSSSSSSSGAAGRKNRSTSYQQAVDNVDYKTNGDVKPPYSYATLICMAMKSNKNKMSLSAIYKWIRDNFMYYRRADTGWQNSIRHNLSLNKCFIKVARNKDEPGKGGFWRLDPKYAEEMADGTFKKRRMSSNRPSAPKKTIGGVVQKKDSNTCSSYYRQQPQNPPPPPPPPLPMPPLETSLLPLISVHPMPPSSALNIGGLHNGSDMLSAEDEAEGEVAAAALKGDFCWNSVLNEDIEVEGLRYKTLDIVDMDGVTSDMAAYQQHQRTTLSQLHASAPTHHSALVSHPYDGIGCLDSPALSLDDDDLLASDTSNDLSDTLDLTVHGTHVTTPDWWSRLTAADGSAQNMTNAIDLTTSSILGHLGGGAGSEYDVASTNSTGNFLSHVWDDATRPVLDGQLDLDGLVDLYVY